MAPRKHDIPGQEQLFEVIDHGPSVAPPYEPVTKFESNGDGLKRSNDWVPRPGTWDPYNRRFIRGDADIEQARLGHQTERALSEAEQRTNLSDEQLEINARGIAQVRAMLGAKVVAETETKNDLPRPWQAPPTPPRAAFLNVPYDSIRELKGVVEKLGEARSLAGYYKKGSGEAGPENAKEFEEEAKNRGKSRVQRLSEVLQHAAISRLEADRAADDYLKVGKVVVGAISTVMGASQAQNVELTSRDLESYWFGDPRAVEPEADKLQADRKREKFYRESKKPAESKTI